MRLSVAAFVTLLAAVGINAQDLTINTPASPVQCLPLLLSWTGGTAPYFLIGFMYRLSILTDVSILLPSASPLVDLGEQQGTSVTWIVNIAAGQQVGLQIRDSTGLVQNSAPFTIQNSSDSSCVGQTVSTSAGSSASTTAAGTTSAGASTTGSSGSSSGATSRTSGASSTQTSSGATSSDTSAALPFAQIAPVGVLGALAAVLFA
ncbi:hypothetical protein PNOK_0769200 [Pyrrhoderma noxium]|uniref:Uncharacterized protein n=1 Tax=Pyrrhoderma noxium TaxID=2282107 RepID=A0A286U912_9AGAM|nr:hypothetical protein PNOK_0769200 [Pyrrhoderma noxium]